MRKYNHALPALQDSLMRRIQNVGEPITLPRLLTFGKARGFPPSHVRLALHNLAQAGLIVFAANPIEVEVVAVEDDE